MACHYGSLLVEMVDYFRQNTYVYILFLRCENAILAILCMVMFISELLELLESEMSLKILRFLSKNAEICDKLYLKYNISPSKFAGSPNICLVLVGLAAGWYVDENFVEKQLF